MSTVLLLGAAACTAAAILFAPAARWTWLGVALLLSGWAGIGTGPGEGGLLLAGVVVAAATEGTSVAPLAGFEDLVGRIGALGVGVALAVLVVTRVLASDLTGNQEVAILVFIGAAASTYVLVQASPVDAARAARVGLLVAACAWVAGGHRGPGVPAATAALLVALGAGVRRLPAVPVGGQA